MMPLSVPGLSGLERFVLGNNNRAAFLPQNELRTSLTKLNETETFQRASRLDTVDIAWQLHAIARIGSSVKCNRTRLGRWFGSK